MIMIKEHSLPVQRCAKHHNAPTSFCKDNATSKEYLVKEKLRRAIHLIEVACSAVTL